MVLKMALSKRSSVLLLCILLRTTLCQVETVQEHSPTNSDVMVLYKSPIMGFLYEPGMSVQEIRDLEESTWHWYPWKHVQYAMMGERELVERECVQEDPLEELPDDQFTRNVI